VWIQVSNDANLHLTLKERIRVMRAEFHQMDVKNINVIYWALTSYRDRLQRDLDTKYDGAEGWSAEDGVFLRGQISDCNEVLDKMNAKREQFFLPG
jgi:hypothetical protein